MARWPVSLPPRMPGPIGSISPHSPSAARASSVGVFAASSGVLPPSSGTGRSPRPSPIRRRAGYVWECAMGQVFRCSGVRVFGCSGYGNALQERGSGGLEKAHFADGGDDHAAVIGADAERTRGFDPIGDAAHAPFTPAEAAAGGGIQRFPGG